MLFEALVGLYNERLEGAHVGAIEEPYSRLGEHAGVLGLALSAVNALMADCCGAVRTGTPYYGARMDDPEDGREIGSRRWEGLVTTNTGKDYAVFQQIHFLMVPAPIKLSARSLLLSVPHEAAHFLLDNLRKADGPLPAVLDIAAAVARGLDAERNYPRVARQLNDEILADIWGYLIGGPAFAHGFDSYYFDTVWDARDDSPEAAPLLILPSTRVSMGALDRRALRWDQHWLDPIEQLEIP